MALSIEFDKTRDQDRHIACGTCGVRTDHRVLTSVNATGSEPDGHYSFDWHDDHEIVQCMGCKTISYRSGSTNSEDYGQDDQGETFYNVTEKLFPPRIEGRRRLEDPWHLPLTIGQMYEETLSALINGHRVLTGIGLRALIEGVCMEKNAEGRTLFEKIDFLKENRILTPTGAEILHHIRTLGNAAAHEVKPHNDLQLRLAMDVVEHLLTDVYILPARAKAVFGERE